MAKNKLSVYLIKEGISEIGDIFEETVEELHKYSDCKCIYFVPSIIHPPKWLKGFFNLTHDKLKQANSKVVLLSSITFGKEKRTFAVTFGYAKHMFKEDVLEEQFGLKVLLNSVNENDLRKISKISVGGNQKQSQEQIPKSGKISEFGFDINRDLVRTVTAKTNDENFDKGILTGGDIFSVCVERDINDIEEFLKICYERFNKKTYKERFDWIDNIFEVRAVSEKNALDNQLIEKIKQKEYNFIWMAVPEVISWESIKHFVYQGSKEAFDDIYIDKVMETFTNDIVDVNQLKSKHIRAVSSEDENNTSYKWTAYRCIIAEIDIEGKSYCLNNGKWYKIDNDFAKRVNSDYENIPLSDIVCPPYDNKGKEKYDEDKYNIELVNSLNNARLLHKTGEISYGGGTGNRIEVCDVMTADKILIHVKKNGGSSYLSHLFNQAAVSAEAMLDEEFRKKFSIKLSEYQYNELIDPQFAPISYKVVIAIINNSKSERPKIPFFSRVAIRYTTRAIVNMGYSVALKNIEIA